MFTNNSYMAFEGIKGAWEELHIFIKFKPRSGNGIILYNGGAESLAFTEDYILVQLINGHIQLKFECGSGPAVINYHEKVEMNAWNTVEIDRFRQYGSISLNGNVAKKGVSKGHSIALNLGVYMVVGGNNDSLEGGVGMLSNGTINRGKGFNGCIQDMIINGKRVDLVRDFLVNKEIMDCNSKVSPCVPSPCVNNGICQVNFFCHCVTIQVHMSFKCTLSKQSKRSPI